MQSFLKKRNSVKVFLCFTSFLLISNLYYLHINSTENQPRQYVFRLSYPSSNKSDDSFLVSTPGCSIPKLNPFDLTVRHFYIQTPSEYDCGPKVPLFHVREHGTVSIDEQVLFRENHIYLNQTDCFFYPILRASSGRKPDDTFQLGLEHPMIFDLPIDDDSVLIECKEGNRTVAKSILPLTPVKKDVEDKREPAARKSSKNTDRLNIIIVGIDSVSKLNFLRYFPRSLSILRKELSAIELHGYTKVADNTYPNLIPFLTGHHSHLYKALEERFGFYDNVDFVWKKYAEAGYRTLFSEDSPAMGTFVLNRRGFKNPPTDYYTRPFSVAAETFNMRRKSHCIGSTLEMKLYFDYLKNFASSMGLRPFFTFTFIAGLTHDVFKNAGFADKPAFDLLTDLKDLGALNRSLLIFFSDHGIRFGDIRQTYIGKIEERMPFMFLAFPNWYKDKYREFYENIRANQNRLTTPYDIHATLLHLLEPEKDSFFTVHGQSLLTEISPERTCADANIAKHWCVCQTHEQVSTDNAAVREASMAVLEHLNKLLRTFASVCATLKLAKILDARMSHPSQQNFENYLITLQVTPSNAVFEATVLRKDKQFEVSEEVSRLNIYGNESHCIRDNEVKKYCYCKIQNS